MGKSTLMGTCKQTIEHLYQFIDRELSDEERREVQAHLDRCPPCREHFRFEENVLSLIGQRCRQVSAPDELKERVRKMCQSA